MSLDVWATFSKYTLYIYAYVFIYVCVFQLITVTTDAKKTEHAFVLESNDLGGPRHSQIRLDLHAESQPV